MLGGEDSSAAPAAVDELRGSSNSGDMEEEKRSGGGEEGGGGGNRWPRHETLELLRIRSEMDSIFRDSTPKAPLWEEVSRKLAELGYKRSAKKCKEKFENVYKYHKRTKDGRTAKHDGKNYRFFQELEAFDGHQQAVVERKSHHQLPPPPPPPALPWITAVSSHQIMGTIPSGGGNNGTSTTPAANGTSTTNTTTSINFTITPPHHQPTVVTPAEPISSSQPLNPSPQSVFHPSYVHHRGQHRDHNGGHGRRSVSATTHLFSSSTSSSTASDEEMEEKGTTKSRKRKRKLKDFFHRLTNDVIKKQEELQKRFLETVEKLDRERLDREGAWRVQEMARINREHEILVHERSTAAAKDAAVLALLQKVSGGGVEGAQIAPPNLSLPSPSPPIPPQQQTLVSQNHPTHVVAQTQKLVPVTKNVGGRIESNAEAGAQTVATTTTTTNTSSRWPKTEVHALIGLRTRLDEKYQENVPKGPLWEEISTEMKKLGYNRNAKRCKEKWENINKYFKKVKESSKKRPEDSKTCPYFHQLDALYREKSIKVIEQTTNNPTSSSGYIEANPIRAVEPAPMQHWLSPPPPQPQPHHAAEEDDDDEEGEDDYVDEETDEEIETSVRRFEIVQSKPSAMTVGGNGD
ncbi:Trihelix transcription factor GT-2 [Linum grandiflorum]